MSELPDEVSVLLQPAFLVDLGMASLDELTVKRDACRRAVAALAYALRLYRADLEVIEAEVEWRSYRLDRQLSMLADTLAASLGAGEEAADPDGPLSGLDLLSEAPGSAAEVTALAAAVRSLSDDELTERAQLVRSASAAAQSRRVALRQTVDRLDAEIAARYRSGEADVAATPDKGSR